MAATPAGTATRFTRTSRDCGAGSESGCGMCTGSGPSPAAAGLAFPNPADYVAAKIGVFIASLSAAVLGMVILYPRRDEETVSEAADKTSAAVSAR